MWPSDVVLEAVHLDGGLVGVDNSREDVPFTPEID